MDEERTEKTSWEARGVERLNLGRKGACCKVFEVVLDGILIQLVDVKLCAISESWWGLSD